VTDEQLLQAQTAREDRVLLAEIDARLDVLLSAADVGPDARAHLRALLQHYAKEPHPFRACVKDNLKRFGPGRTERVCATLKDMIRGTTRWRHGSEGVVASGAPEISEEVAQLVLSLPDDALERIVMEVAR
jgi:hypothetical protein